jgi:hypothetical protein
MAVVQLADVAQTILSVAVTFLSAQDAASSPHSLTSGFEWNYNCIVHSYDINNRKA